MWDVIIPSSLRLLLKMWIWYRYRNRKLLAPWWRIIGFYKKVHIKTQSKKLCITRTNDSKLFNKKLHSRKRQMSFSTLNKWLNRQITRIPLSAERNWDFPSLYGRSNCDTFWENEGKIHERACVKTSLQINFFTDNFQF